MIICKLNFPPCRHSHTKYVYWQTYWNINEAKIGNFTNNNNLKIGREKKKKNLPDSLIEGEPVDTDEFVLKLVDVELSETDLLLYNAKLVHIFNSASLWLKPSFFLTNSSRCRYFLLSFSSRLCKETMQDKNLISLVERTDFRLHYMGTSLTSCTFPQNSVSKNSHEPDYRLRKIFTRITIKQQKKTVDKEIPIFQHNKQKYGQLIFIIRIMRTVYVEKNKIV